jgi:hypothetical protein
MQNRSQGFVQKRIQTNPVIMRILRQHRGSTAVWWLIAIVSLISFLGSLADKDNRLFNWLTFIGGLTLVVNPLWGAQTAAAQTCQMTKSEAYQLLFLTTLSDMKLIEAYIFASIYRLRIVLVFMLSMIPAVLIRLTDSAFNNYNFCIRYLSNCTPPTTTAVFHWFLVYSTAILAAIGVFLFGVVLATALALWWRNRHAAGIGALLLVSFLIGLFFLFPSVSQPDNDPIATLIPAIPYTILIYIATLGIALAAQRVARPRP